MICQSCGVEIANKALICFSCGEASSGAVGRQVSEKGRLGGRLFSLFALVFLSVVALLLGRAPLGDLPTWATWTLMALVVVGLAWWVLRRVTKGGARRH